MVVEHSRQNLLLSVRQETIVEETIIYVSATALRLHFYFHFFITFYHFIGGGGRTQGTVYFSVFGLDLIYCEYMKLCRV